MRRAHASPVSPQDGDCQPPPRTGAAALKQPMTRKFASWSWPWWVKSQAMSGAALARRCSRPSSRMTCCCASTTSSFAAGRRSARWLGAAGLSRSRGGSPHGRAAGGVHGGRQARGATRCRPGPAALCTPSNPNPNRTRTLTARPYAGCGLILITTRGSLAQRGLFFWFFSFRCTACRKPNGL